MRLLVRNKAVLLLLALVLVTIAPDARPIYAQSNSHSPKRAKTVAANFFRKDLSIYGFSIDPHMKELRPYFSPRFYSLLRYELRRRDAWVAKNPDMVPPVLEDFFVCNHRERPARFRIGGASVRGSRARVTVHFDYWDGSRYVEDCKSQASLVLVKGRWLLDNVFFDDEADLRKVFSRKDYVSPPN
jgi:hypothetical protein